MPEEREIKKQDNKGAWQKAGPVFSSEIACKTQRLIEYIQGRFTELTQVKHCMELPLWMPDYNLFSNTEWAHRLVSKVSTFVDSLHSLIFKTPTLLIEPPHFIWYHHRRKKRDDLLDIPDGEDAILHDTEYGRINITEPKSTQTIAADGTLRAMDMPKMQRRPFVRHIRYIPRRLPDIRLTANKPLKTDHRGASYSGKLSPYVREDTSFEIMYAEPPFKQEKIAAEGYSVSSGMPTLVGDYTGEREPELQISRVKPTTGITAPSHKGRIFKFIKDIFKPSYKMFPNVAVMAHLVTEADEMPAQPPPAPFPQRRSCDLPPSYGADMVYPPIFKLLPRLNVQQLTSEWPEQAPTQPIAQNLIHPSFKMPLIESFHSAAPPSHPETGMISNSRGAHQGLVLAPLGRSKESIPAPAEDKGTGIAGKTSSGEKVEPDQNIDKLARDVYTHLKRRLAWEREHSLVK